jgi:hypothetical protein
VTCFGPNVLAELNGGDAYAACCGVDQDTLDGEFLFLRLERGERLTWPLCMFARCKREWMITRYTLGIVAAS